MKEVDMIANVLNDYGDTADPIRVDIARIFQELYGDDFDMVTFLEKSGYIGG